ncbi:helix-turn-helix transcriptional regulator [Streptomyces sp. C1-2]|uniref:helix-turn-helix domain-containing protein n=1 Tax=Streptomyces sp. C1-2 TaxID=2720022 RepID=UPI00143267D2|nr:helix-turn-helix transcriptional regulator [Streptomyces sp. C1-2]NJP73185.1 helix-turn-helix transcriptional regulator [Streptomyces sp. C1-2]
MPAYRLRSARLREAAAARGDRSNYAIAKRTGLNQTTLSRLVRGIARPAADTLLTLSAAYSLSVDELIDREGDGNGDGAGGPAPTPLAERTTATT